jgi:thioredoxin 1
MAYVSELTNGEFESFSKDEGLLFIDFFADWCMPCVMMGPIVDDLATDFEDKVKFGKVNIDDNPEITAKFEISSVPTFVLMKEGTILEKISGALTQEELKEIIEKNIKNLK